MKTSQTVNTKNLSDKEAEIALAVENLYKICKKYNSTMFSRVVINDQNYIGAFSICSGIKDKKRRDAIFLIDLMGKFVEECTDGEMKIVKA